MEDRYYKFKEWQQLEKAGLTDAVRKLREERKAKKRVKQEGGLNAKRARKVTFSGTDTEDEPTPSKH